MGREWNLIADEATVVKDRAPNDKLVHGTYMVDHRFSRLGMEKPGLKGQSQRASLSPGTFCAVDL